MFVESEVLKPQNCALSKFTLHMYSNAIATIKRRNAKNDQQKEYPEWIKDSDNQYMTIKRPLRQSDQERGYEFDKDYRCDPWDRPDLYDQSSLTFKEQPIAPPVDKNTSSLDEQSSSQSPKEDTHGSTKKSTFPDDFPLNSTKEYIAEKVGGTYIPLHSTLVLKKRRKMVYLPIEFDEITMDGLVDSAFINAMSWSDYNIIKMNRDICVIREYPQPSFKIECANAQLEQPIATADIQFNIGTLLIRLLPRFLLRISTGLCEARLNKILSRLSRVNENIQENARS